MPLAESVPSTVQQSLDGYVYTLVDSSFESDTESVECGFPAHDPAGPSFAGRVEGPDSVVATFQRGLLVWGEWPLALTARRILASSDSMALVE